MTTETKGLQLNKVTMTIEGDAPIMFDPFTGQEKDTKPPEQKFYYYEGKVVLPSENVYAFLFGESPAGCAKSLEGKSGKEYIRLGQAHVYIDPVFIPFTKNGKELVFTEFDNETFAVTEFAPRTKMGSLSIKQNIKKRPVILPPWRLSFNITVIKNAKIDVPKLINWFTTGGVIIGLGTYRPRFGRFSVVSCK